MLGGNVPFFAHAKERKLIGSGLFKFGILLDLGVIGFIVEVNLSCIWLVGFNFVLDQGLFVPDLMEVDLVLVIVIGSDILTFVLSI